jgi:hypothetical protein
MLMRSAVTPIERLLVSFALLAAAAPAFAHHSAAAYDTQKEVKVSGTVVQYRFANPHVYLTLEVKKDDGTTSRMEVEAGAAAVLNGLGFTRDSIKNGDIVTVVGSPARAKPEAFLLGRELYKRDGTYVPLHIASRSVFDGKTATATSIAGTWFSPRSGFATYLGGAGRWSLTEKGRAAAAAGADERVKNALKDCIPVGAPLLMLYPVANTITVQRDRILMKVDWMDSERIVYLDGRAHPPAAQTSLQGHSVGRWQGKTLVVETTNFKENPIGLSVSMPSSTQKKLTERFALSDDGKTLIYSGVLEDPVYLAKPVEWSGSWEYRPTMKPSGEKCNIEVASRFLRTEK